MYLADSDITKAIKDGDITITPFVTKQLQPASYDIRLGNKFLIAESHKHAAIDPVKKKFPETREVKLKDNETFVLHPGMVVLGFSHEKFGSKRYLTQLHGKSSLARIGLLVHATADIINPGHYLHVVFELFNNNNIPIVLRPNMEIGQLTFATLSTEPRKDYSGRYTGDNWAGGK